MSFEVRQSVSSRLAGHRFRGLPDIGDNHITPLLRPLLLQSYTAVRMGRNKKWIGKNHIMSGQSLVTNNTSFEGEFNVSDLEGQVV